MKLSLGIVLLGAGIAVVACSTAIEDEMTSDPTPADDGGTVPPPSGDAGADVVDASVVDADAEAAAPKVCSDDGFCHTKVGGDQKLTAVWGDGAGVAWAVTEDGAILRWDGAAWSVHTKTKGALFAVWGSGPTDLWIGGAAGLYHGTGASSAAITFAGVDAPGDTRAPITSIWGTGDKDVWAVGSYLTFPYVARVLHYSDGFAGAGWKLDTVSQSPILTERVWGSATSGVWIAGTRNNPVTINREVVVLRRAVSSGAFVEVPMPKDPKAQFNGEIDKLFDGAIGGDGTVWVLGRTNTSSPGFARGTTTNGVDYAFSFIAYGPSVGPQSRFVGGAGKNDHWVGGEYGRLAHFDGASFTQAKTTITKFPDTTPLTAMWRSAAGEMWVVGEGIALHKSPPKK